MLLTKNIDVDVSDHCSGGACGLESKKVESGENVKESLVLIVVLGSTTINLSFLALVPSLGDRHGTTLLESLLCWRQSRNSNSEGNDRDDGGLHFERFDGLY